MGLLVLVFYSGKKFIRFTIKLCIFPIVNKFRLIANKANDHGQFKAQNNGQNFLSNINKEGQWYFWHGFFANKTSSISVIK